MRLKMKGESLIGVIIGLIIFIFLMLLMSVVIPRVCPTSTAWYCMFF